MQVIPEFSTHLKHRQCNRTCTRLLSLCALATTCGLLGVWLGAVAGMLDGTWSLTWTKACIPLWTALGTALLYALGACRERDCYGLLPCVSVPCAFVCVCFGPCFGGAPLCMGVSISFFPYT
jgi:hypothetical protein